MTQETKEAITFTAPLYIQLSNAPKAKKYHLNLNNYRNWHYQVSNNLKKRYKEIMSEQLKGVVFDKPIRISFILFKGTKRKCDRSNVLSVQEKFFCDCLTEMGCIPDDNDDYITGTDYSTGGLDRIDPRVEIIIHAPQAGNSHEYPHQQ